MNAALGALLGALVVVGLILLVWGLRPSPVRPRRHGPSIIDRLRARLRTAGVRARALLVGIVLGVVLTSISGLPVLMILIPAFALTLPSLFTKPPVQVKIAQAEALETWIRGLSGVLVAGIGLEEAIRTSLPSTPAPIRAEVARLVARLQAQQPIETALRSWADEMDSQISDLVAAALIMGARTRRGGLAKALEDLSAAVADQTRMLHTVEAERSGPRTTARIVMGIMIAMFTLVMANPQMSAPYATPLGQLVLLAIGLGYIGLLRWIKSIVEGKPKSRFLTSSPVGAP